MWTLFQASRKDEVEAAVDDLRNQGADRARLAHMFASLLVVCFSAGSLVALGSDALNSVLTQWQTNHTLNLPSTISLAVSFLMVLAMDMALINAAGTLRVLAARRAGYGERWVHIGVMVVVGVLESGTYAYMSWKFEHPVGLAAQVLITARALAAPLLAVYLSMAKQLPVTARELLGMAELSSGGGVLRNVIAAAHGRNINLAGFANRMRLFAASAIMFPEDRARLQGMIQAVIDSVDTVGQSTATQEGRQLDQNEPTTSIASVTPEPSDSHPDHDFDKPPTGPGTPTVSPVRTDDSEEKNIAPGTIKLVPRRTQRAAARVLHPKVVRTPPMGANLEDLARKAWKDGYTSIERMRRHTGMSRTAAASWVRTLRAEDTVRAQQQTAQ